MKLPQGLYIGNVLSAPPPGQEYAILFDSYVNKGLYVTGNETKPTDVI